MLVTWDADGPVTLSVSRDANLTGSKSLYQGSEQSYFLSGLANGDYYLVVEAANGERSNPVILSVEHQSLTRALWLTLLGAVITLGIVITIMRGARR